MTELKLASTIMLGRDYNDALEILLVKRNKSLAFAAGLWVFPGGKIEEEEILQGKDELHAARIAAVRETKEEADLDINADQLIFFRHWTTPVNEPRRYATYFFFGACQAVASDVQVDDSEIIAYQWVTPQLALQQFADKKIAMMPPTILSLQLISKCRSTDEASLLLSAATPVFVLPVIHYLGGKVFCLYEGDAGYDVGDATRAGARHRLVLDMTTGVYSFEFEGCVDILPVDGGIHR